MLMDESASQEMSDSSRESSQLSLSCSFSSFENDSHPSEADDTDEEAISTVEPYMYEPEVPIREDLVEASDDNDDSSSDEGRIGNTDW